MSDNPLQVAREHVAQGEEILAKAWKHMSLATSSEPTEIVALNVAVANAHFSAAMAITNIELTVEPDCG